MFLAIYSFAIQGVYCLLGVGSYFSNSDIRYSAISSSDWNFVANSLSGLD
jgi:hypothetical protein